MRRISRFLACALWGALTCAAVQAEPPLAREVLAAVRDSGVPIKNFGFYARPVEKDESEGAIPLVSLNAEQTFLLASTTKVVTSLAALDLLGPGHSWPLRAYASGPLTDGRLRGDLVIAGNRQAVTGDELRRWFSQMRAEGLHSVSGQIVLEDVLLVPPENAAAAAASAAAGNGSIKTPAPPAVEWSDEARAYNEGSMILSIEPAAGERATVVLTPRPIGVQIVNDVMMGGPCDAWARWSDPRETGGGPPQLWVRGRWDVNCPKEYIAYIRPLPGMKYAPNVVLPDVDSAMAPRPLGPLPALVARLWTETGGNLRGRVVETDARLPQHRGVSTAPAWSSEFSVPLSQVVREINKTSDNVAARSLLLSLGSGSQLPGEARQRAKDRVHEWLRKQGLVDGDIRVDLGSGQSREERGRPRAMVQLLRNAWKTEGAQAFVNSLPIAGFDGTLVNRMKGGAAAGEAFLKTGTLSDTRALAGYVRSRSGKVYAVTAIVNHAEAAKARSVLDVFIAWVAKNG